MATMCGHITSDSIQWTKLYTNQLEKDVNRKNTETCGKMQILCENTGEHHYNADHYKANWYNATLFSLPKYIFSIEFNINAPL